MASSDNHYGADSESDDDNFNPAPADLSDDENDGARNARNKSPQISSPAPEDDQRYARPSGGASKRPIQLTRDDEDDDEEVEEDEEEDEEEAVQKNNADDDEDDEDDEDEDDVQGVSTDLPPSLRSSDSAGALWPRRLCALFNVSA